jgi:hypothetical protein
MYATISRMLANWWISFVTCPGYVKTGSYSIANMEQREVEIRTQAEQVVSSKLSFHQRLIFNCILFEGSDIEKTSDFLAPSFLEYSDIYSEPSVTI